MLLEILWVFDKYLPQPCFPEWHENREIIQRDVKNMFPSKSNTFIIIIIILTIKDSLSFRQISVTALLPEKRIYTKTGNHTELSNVYFSQNPKYDTFKLNILISFVYWQRLLLNLDFSAIKVTLHCNFLYLLLWNWTRFPSVWFFWVLNCQNCENLLPQKSVVITGDCCHYQ